METNRNTYLTTNYLAMNIKIRMQIKMNKIDIAQFL